MQTLSGLYLYDRKPLEKLFSAHEKALLFLLLRLLIDGGTVYVYTQEELNKKKKKEKT